MGDDAGEFRAAAGARRRGGAAARRRGGAATHDVTASDFFHEMKREGGLGASSCRLAGVLHAAFCGDGGSCSTAPDFSPLSAVSVAARRAPAGAEPTR